MPRKVDDLTFLRNQLRWFIACRGKYAPTPATRFRAMLTLAALGKHLDVSFKDKEAESGEKPEGPVTGTLDAQTQAMLDAAVKRGGSGAKLSSSESSGS